MSLIRRALSGLIIVSSLVAVPAFATDYYADVLGGPWTSSSTWHLLNNSGPPAPAGTYPGSGVGDRAIVDFQGIFVTLNASIPNAVTVDFNNVSCGLNVNAGAFLPLTGNSQLAGGCDLNFSGGTISNAGTLTIGSPSAFNWTGGTLTGSGATVIPSGVSVNATGSSMILSGQTLNLAGNFIYGPAASGLTVNSGATINVQNGALFDLQNSSGIGTDNNANPKIAVASGGTFKKTAGNFGTNILVPLNNAGLVQTDINILVLTGGTHTGTFTMNGASTGIGFANGPTFQNGTTINGLGTASFSHVIVNGTVTATNVSMDSFGSIGGGGTLQVSGTFTWRGGSVHSSSTLEMLAASTLNYTGESAAEINSSAHVNMKGTFNVNPGVGNFAIKNGGHLTNDGPMNLLGDVTIDSDGANNARIDNLATRTIGKSTGAASAFIKPALNNAGSVSVTSGVLKLMGGGTHSGGFSTGTGNGLAFDGGVHQFLAGSSLSGTGTFGLVAGTMDVDVPLAVPATATFQQSGGVLTGAGTFTVNGPFLWTGGTMDNSSGGGKTILNSSTAQIASTASTLILSGRRLENLNTLTYNPTVGIELSIDDGGELYNNATFNLVGDAEIDSNNNLTPKFTNDAAGTINKSTGTGIADVFAFFSGAGTINLTSGSIAFHGDGQNLGTVNFGGITNKVIVDSCKFDITVTPTLGTAGKLTVTGAGARLVLSANLNGAHLELLGGQIEGGGNLSVSGSLLWQDGAMIGPGLTTIGNLGAVTANSLTGPITIDNRTFANNGIFQWNGTTFPLHVINGGVLSNTNIFDAQGDGFIGASGGGTINNAGTFKKSGGISGTRIDPVMNNTGTLSSEVSGQSLIVAGGGSQTAGTLAVTTGALLDFFSGTFTVSGGSSAGSGTFRVNGGTLDVDVNLTVPNTAILAVESGALDVAPSRTLQVFNQFLWKGGTLQNDGTTRVFGGLIGNVAPTTLANNHTLTVAGSLSCDADNVNFLTIGGTANLNVESGSTLTITSNGRIAGTSTDGVTVSGTLVKNGFGVARIETPLTMTSGTAPSFGATSGVLQLAGGGSSNVTSTLNTGATGTVEFAGGTFNIGAGTTLAGSGTIGVSGGTLNVNTVLIFPKLALSGGTLAGSGALTINGGTWSGGTIAGSAPFTFGAPAVFNITGSNGAMTLDTRTLTNDGDVDFLSANALSLVNGAAIDNNSVFDIVSNGPINGGASFTNDGTFRKIGGGGTTSFGPPFTNNNAVNLTSGTVAFNGGFTQNGGSTVLNVGNMSSPSLVDLNGGTLSGNGIITANVDNAATINPGLSPGMLVINGNYTQSGTLNIEIGGTTLGTGYDRLAVNGTATLGGTMNASLVNGYVPAGGEIFDVVTYTSHGTSTFGNEVLPTFGSSGSFVSTYTPTSYQLAAVTGQADVASSQTTSGPTVLHGQNATFTITIKNLGADTANGVTLSDTLTGATVVSIASTIGTCTTAPLACNIGVLTSGQSAVVTLTVNANALGTINNSAFASANNVTSDPNGSNNTSNASINVSPAADIIVLKSGPANATSGNTIVYTIQVKNSGPDTASNVTLSDVTPSTLIFQSNAGACTTPFPCSLGNMVSGETKTVTSTYIVEPAAAGSTVVNGASASSPTADPSTGNNSASVATTIDCTTTPPSDLAPAGTAATNGVLTWNAAGADFYDVFLGTAGSGCATFLGTTSGTSMAYSNLQPNALYEWRVVGRSAGACSASSACVTFTTQTNCTTPGTPVARVVGQTATAKTYDVEFDAVPGATHYTIEEATNEAFTGATVFNLSAAQLSKSFVHDVTTPTAFFYRVRAFNECTPGGGAYSLPVRIVILPIAPPSQAPTANAPAGTDELIVQRVFIPGQPNQTLLYSATTDQPWLTVRPPSGTIPPEGITLEAVADPSQLPNGTWTATVIVTINTPSGAIHSNATTTVSAPVSVSLVTPVTPVPVKGSTSPSAVIIPAIGHLDGIDSHWQSDVRVTNTGFRAVRYRLTFTQSGGTALGVKQTDIRVDAGTTTALDDIVRNWFGLGSLADGASGMLEVVPLDDVENAAKATVVTSRTYNVQEKGTLGQFIPAIPFASFIGRSTSALPSILSLQQLAQNNIYRTNVGIAEASGVPVSAVMSIFNASGNKLTDIPAQLLGGQQLQFNALLAQNNIQLDDGRIEVKVSDGNGKITAYASVIDGGTGDPLLVDGVQLQPTVGSRKYVLPGAASLNTGFANWQTDMRVFNFGTIPQPATLTFFPMNNGAPRVAQVTANPGQVLALDNIVKSLFSSENLGGAVHIDTAQPSSLVVTARTYNVTDEGTLGQFISAVTPAQALGANEGSFYIPQVEDSTRYRTNIGLSEVSGQETVVELQVKLPDAKITSAVQLTLAPNEFRQLALIRELQLGNVYNALVTVRVVRGGRVTAYGSVIDEKTGDPTFVPPQKTK